MPRKVYACKIFKKAWYYYHKSRTRLSDVLSHACIRNETNAFNLIRLFKMGADEYLSFLLIDNFSNVLFL